MDLVKSGLFGVFLKKVDVLVLVEQDLEGFCEYKEDECCQQEDVGEREERVYVELIAFQV